MIVSVTEEDIRQGEPGKSDACPVQRAVMRAIKKSHLTFPPSIPITKVSVQYSGIYLAGKGRNGYIHSDWEAPLPLSVNARIRDFDLVGKMQPFTFVLDIPWKDSSPHEHLAAWWSNLLKRNSEVVSVVG